MEEEIHVVDSGIVPAADSSSMVLVTDENGEQQILHFSNHDESDAEMLLEDLQGQLPEETMTIMQQETIGEIDYCAHQRAAEVLQSMGDGVTSQVEEVSAVNHTQAIVYVESCDQGNERSLTSDAIAAALQQAGATNGDEHSQVIVLEGGSDGMVNMAEVGEDFQGTLIVIMQQDEQQGGGMESTHNVQEVQEASAFIEPKADELAEQNVAAFHSTQVFHQPDESFKENIECKDVSQEPVLQKPYHCNFCDKKFAWKRSLFVHERIHTGENLFTCNQCGKMYASKVSLQTHIGTHIRQEDKPFCCDVCGKRFTKKWDLETHKWQHTGQKKYICEHCGKTYARNSDLRRHVLSHTGNKPFQCRFCGKRFITRWHYNYHERRHTGEKPYQCQLCWKQFMQKCHLDRHEITHASETYNCQHCGRKYMHKNELTRHERTHIKCLKPPEDCTTDVVDTGGNVDVTGGNDDTGENVDAALEYLMAFAQGQVGIDALKEDINSSLCVSTGQVAGKGFKCGVCKKSFADAEELQRHKEDHNLNSCLSTDLIYCKYCSRTFKYKASFIKHVTTHAAFHFDDELGDLKQEIEDHAKYILPLDSSIFVCIRCYRAYSVEEKLEEHRQVCTEKLPHENMIKDEVVFRNEILQSQVSTELTGAESTVPKASEFVCDEIQETDESLKDSMEFQNSGIEFSTNNTTNDNNDASSAQECFNRNLRVQNTKTFLAVGEEGQEIRIPLSDLIYVCRFCNSEFKYKTSFERHEEQHEGNTVTGQNHDLKSRRPFICTLCGVGFRRPFHLTRHMETHSKKSKPRSLKKSKPRKAVGYIAGSESCAEIQEIVDIVRSENDSSENTTPLPQKLDVNSDTVHWKNDQLVDNDEDCCSEEDVNERSEEYTSVLIENKFKLDENVGIRRTLTVESDKLDPSQKLKADKSPNKAIITLTTTRSRRSIRLPKRFRKEENNMLHVSEEVEKEIEDASTENKEDISCTTAVTPKRKRGRPKKLNKETFECMECKKTFLFQSLLKLHTLSKHKIKQLKSVIAKDTKQDGINTFAMKQRIHEEEKSVNDNWSVSRDLEDDVTTVTNVNESNDTTCDSDSGIQTGRLNNSKTQEMFLDEQCYKKVEQITGMSSKCQETTTKEKSNTTSINDVDETLQSESKVQEDIIGDCQTQICTRSKAHEFLCDQCGRKFSTQAKALHHQQYHAGKDRGKKSQRILKKRLICNECHKVFKTSTLLKRHELLHVDKKPFRCITCSKTFRRGDDLKRHNMIHSGKKPFSCDVCGKAFAYKFPLKMHLQSHTGVRPHMCDVCGKMFAKKFDMEAHRNMHSGNTPHVCNICNKKYGRKADLDRHMTKHTGTQPLSCSFCERKFSTRWHLQYHERTHTGEKPYICDICGRKFSQSPHLNKHMVHIHGKSKPSASNTNIAEDDIDDAFDSNNLLKSVVEGLQLVSQGEGSVEHIHDASHQIIQVVQVEDCNPTEMQVFSLILP